MYLAWNEIKRNKLKYSMIGFIVFLIAWLVFMLTGLGNGLKALNSSALQNIPSNYLVFEKESDNSFSKSLISGENAKQLAANKKIKDVALMGANVASLQNETKGTDKKTDVMAIGIKPGAFIEPTIFEGEKLNVDNTNQVIADVSLKNQDFKLGDQVKFSGKDQTYEIIGFVKNQTLNHLPTIWLPLDAWQANRFSIPGSDDGVKNPVSALVLDTEKKLKETDIKAISKNSQLATKKQAIQGVPGFKEENATIMMMLVFLVVISAIVMGVFFYVLTMQKVPQFGVMKAMGANNKFISKMILSQVAMITLMGIVIGALVTFLIASVLPESMPFDLDYQLVLLYGALIFIISLASTLFSVRQIVKIDPLIALGRVE